MYRISSIIVSLLFAILGASAAQKIAIVVDGTIDDDDKFIIESRVAQSFSGSRYTILERSEEFQSLLTREHSYQLSGEVSPSDICKLGERWGANTVVGIYVIERRGTMVATVKIMNVTTGRVIGTLSNHKLIRTTDDLIMFAATLGVNVKRELTKVL